MKSFMTSSGVEGGDIYYGFSNRTSCSFDIINLSKSLNI